MNDNYAHAFVGLYNVGDVITLFEDWFGTNTRNWSIGIVQPGLRIQWSSGPAGVILHAMTASTHTKVIPASAVSTFIKELYELIDEPQS